MEMGFFLNDNPHSSKVTLSRIESGAGIFISRFDLSVIS